MSFCNLDPYAREHGGVYGMFGAIVSALTYFFIKTA